MAIKNHYESTIFLVSRNISHGYWYCTPLSLLGVLTTRTRQCGRFVVFSFLKTAGHEMQSTSSVFLEPLIPRVHQLCQSRQIHVSLQSFPRFFLNKELGEDFQVDKLGTSVLSWEFSDGIFRLSPAIQRGWQDWKKHLTGFRFLLSYIHVYPMFAYRAPGIYYIYM